MLSQEVNDVKILYAHEDFLTSFHQTFSLVAKEKIYIERIEAPPLEELNEFVQKQIVNNWPMYFALKNNQVIGWCDSIPMKNPRLHHRAILGMAVHPHYRGRGLGKQLLEKVLEHSKNIGIEKLELTVYAKNEPAIKLYQNFGFEEEGLIKHYRKLDGKYFDCLLMRKFL